jgi:hypothetical protein
LLKPSFYSKALFSLPKFNHHYNVWVIYPLRSRLERALLAALDWKVDMALVVVKNPDGSVTVKKAA